MYSKRPQIILFASCLLGEDFVLANKRSSSTGVAACDGTRTRRSLLAAIGGQRRREVKRLQFSFAFGFHDIFSGRHDYFGHLLPREALQVRGGFCGNMNLTGWGSTANARCRVDGISKDLKMRGLLSSQDAGCDGSRVQSNFQ